MLIVSNVTKKYGKNLACDNISFMLESGTTTVLLGPNGAGKSTIIKSIIGFLKYDGEITVNGIYNKTTEARRILGYIPEIPALYPSLTVGEHIEFLARAYKLEDYKDRANNLLERYDLLDKTKKFGDELSKGMQQKLNICLGLLPDPEVILLDEPMIGLDPYAIKSLKEDISIMSKNGKTLLISTHIIDSVDMIWDRALIMQKGRIMANVKNEDVNAAGKNLEQIFFENTENVSEHEMQNGSNPEDFFKVPEKKGLFGRNSGFGGNLFDNKGRFGGFKK